MFLCVSCFSALDESWIAGNQDKHIYHRIDHLVMLESFSYPFYGYFYLTDCLVTSFNSKLQMTTADTSSCFIKLEQVL